MYFQIILISILGFVSGSILFGKIIPKAVCGVDIEAVSEDGNPGTSNVYKYCGYKCGTVTAILEFAKGFFPVLIANCIVPPDMRTELFVFAIIAPVIGHIFSIFHAGNGGMGIATTFGTLIAVFFDTHLLILLVGIYAIARFLLNFKHQYIRTLSVFGCFALATLIFENNIIYKHAYFLLAVIICGKCAFNEIHVRQTASEI